MKEEAYEWGPSHPAHYSTPSPHTTLHTWNILAGGSWCPGSGGSVIGLMSSVAPLDSRKACTIKAAPRKSRVCSFHAASSETSRQFPLSGEGGSREPGPSWSGWRALHEATEALWQQVEGLGFGAVGIITGSHRRRRK